MVCPKGKSASLTRPVKKGYQEWKQNQKIFHARARPLGGPVCELFLIFLQIHECKPEWLTDWSVQVAPVPILDLLHYLEDGWQKNALACGELHPEAVGRKPGTSLAGVEHFWMSTFVP